ncbi:MAG: hypothetical protein J7K81_09350 [Methanophagales archaeon]|nr:hypothetical protein [Methanophagales archaeon]
MKETEGNDSTMDVIGRISVLEGKVSEHDRIFDMINTRLGEMNKRIDGTNERIDSLRLSVDKKIDDVNKRIEGMDTRINSRIEGMDIRLNGRIDSNFKWMLGVQITMWITIIVAILLH